MLTETIRPYYCSVLTEEISVLQEPIPTTAMATMTAATVVTGRTHANPSSRILAICHSRRSPTRIVCQSTIFYLPSNLDNVAQRKRYHIADRSTVIHKSAPALHTSTPWCSPTLSSAPPPGESSPPPPLALPRGRHYHRRSWKKEKPPMLARLSFLSWRLRLPWEDWVWRLWIVGRKRWVDAVKFELILFGFEFNCRCFVVRFWRVITLSMLRQRVWKRIGREMWFLKVWRMMRLGMHWCNDRTIRALH